MMVMMVMSRTMGKSKGETRVTFEGYSKVPLRSGVMSQIYVKGLRL